MPDTLASGVGLIWSLLEADPGLVQASFGLRSALSSLPSAFAEPSPEQPWPGPTQPRFRTGPGMNPAQEDPGQGPAPKAVLFAEQKATKGTKALLSKRLLRNQLRSLRGLL